MSQSTVQFVTQMKLRELNRQRARLREAYRQLTEEIQQARSSEDRLRRLYTGLRALTFAGQPLHPETVNLEILLYEIEAGVLSPDVLQLWLERLESELAAGKARAEFVYLFGAMLEEWTRQVPENERFVEEQQQAQQQLLATALTPPQPNRHREILEPLFEGAARELAACQQSLQAGCRLKLTAPLKRHELNERLESLAKSVYQPPSVRREARQFAKDAALQQELADALTLLLAEGDAWDWPAEGLRPRTLWTRNKWRLFLNESLPTVCLLEILGKRWQEILAPVLDKVSLFTGGRTAYATSEVYYTPEGHPVRRTAFWEGEVERKLRRLVLPITEIEEQAFEYSDFNSFPLEAERGDSDPFSETEALTIAEEDEPEYDSIVSLRANHQVALRHINRDSDYGAYGAGNDAIPLVHAEIQLARAAFPDAPVYVVKLDLQDYYASIHQDVLLTILSKLGLPEREIAFFTHYLKSPIQTGKAELERMQRGILTGHTLSDLLAELLLRLLEHYVQQEAAVRIVRLVDDICILTPDAQAAVTAWERIEAFCAACGLQVNREKSGAVCIGGALPETLPQALPRWAMLELNAQGEWQLHQETFEAHLTQSCEQVSTSASILSRVQRYNANARFLLGGLGLGFALGDTHRTAIRQAVRRFHKEFFEPERGIVSELCADITRRFLQDAHAPVDIPEAWVCWPITAGGLGLQSPVLIAGQYHESYIRRTQVPIPKTRPHDWNTTQNEWSAYYASCLRTVSPVTPEKTRVMETLVQDFIARGASISEGKQKELTPYWRWILYMYGPQILQRFGTFRFLITELVPLQLISLQRLQDTSLDDTE